MKFKKPEIILVRPQLPENIGMVARAMNNFGFKSLSLVSPREEWPNKKSLQASKQSKIIIKNTKIYNSLSNALEKYNLVIATTNRKRFLEKKIINSFNDLNNLIHLNKKVAIIFGPENSGLSNYDLRLADYLFSIKTSKEKNSLNLSHAVSIITHNISEYFDNEDNKINKTDNKINLTGKKELNYFMNYLVKELDKVKFFYPLAKKQSMIDNIYALFLKSSLTKKELNTLWGMIKKLKKQ